MVGYITCFALDHKHWIGYWIARQHWGRGIATRALQQLLGEVGVRPLHARAARSNAASIRVLERCGFEVTGYHMAPADDRFPACEEAVLRLD
jgi:RimJ/RimL family protein N-acetyltransferase